MAAELVWRHAVVAAVAAVVAAAAVAAAGAQPGCLNYLVRD